MAINIKPIGHLLIGIFLALSICILEASGFSLLLPGTFLDGLWAWQPQKLAQIIPYRFLVGTLFIIMGVFFTITVVGWFKRKKWGWKFTIAIFIINGIGDAVGIFTGDLWGGIIGVCIAILILLYLFQPKVRGPFNNV